MAKSMAEAVESRVEPHRAAPTLDLTALAALGSPLRWLRGSDPPREMGCASFEELSEALSAASLRAVLFDPVKALQAGEAAVLSARAIRLSSVGTSRSAELRAEAWASVANARRALQDFGRAELAWHRVERLLLFAKPNPGLLARVAWLRGSLRRDQRHIEEAAVDIASAVAHAKRALDPHAEGVYRLAWSSLLRYQSQPHTALRQVLEAQRLLDPNREPQHLFGALHQEVVILADLGMTAHALLISKQIEPLYLKFTGPVFHLRGLWVKGQLHARVGEQATAAAHFEHIRGAFLDRGLLYDAALVSLDLALAYAELGERQRVWRLAHQMYEVFLAQQIPRETSAVLILFARTALEEKADAAFILDILGRLASLRRDQGAL